MAVLTGGVNSQNRKNGDVLYLYLFNEVLSQNKEHHGPIECSRYLCITRKCLKRLIYYRVGGAIKNLSLGLEHLGLGVPGYSGGPGGLHRQVYSTFSFKNARENAKFTRENSKFARENTKFGDEK